MKPKLIPALVISISFTLAFGGTAKATPIAHLTLQSQPGDPIGQGGNFDITYTPANSQFFSVGSSSNFVAFFLGTVTGGPDNTLADITFTTNQLGIPIQPGVYLNAQRAVVAASGHPGLDVSFQNRGCNMLTGSFTVQSAQFAAAGTSIANFAASFEQHCEGITPALFGIISFNANPVPEPPSVLLASAVLFLFAILKKCQSQEAWPAREKKKTCRLSPCDGLNCRRDACRVHHRFRFNVMPLSR